MDNFKQAFKGEAYELLSELENALLDLESSPQDLDLVGRVFRTMHTIKGSGSMFGFDAIAEFTHEVETILDTVRMGNMAVTSELISLILLSRDHILAMLDAEESGETISLASTNNIVSKLRNLVSRAPGEPEDVPMEDSCSLETMGETSPCSKQQAEMVLTYRIVFHPTPTLFHTGCNPLHLLEEIRELGEATIVAHIDDIPSLEKMDAECCYTSWDIILTTDKGENAIKDVFIFVEEEDTLSIEIIDDNTCNGTLEYKRLGEILVDKGEVADSELQQFLKDTKKIGERLVTVGLTGQSQVNSALAEQEHVRNQQQKRTEKQTSASIRVDADKLDRLVDLVGELVTIQARFSQKAKQENDSEWIVIAEAVEALTTELRDAAMGIRMLPIATTFSKFGRLVRDLSREQGKKIALITEGEETELDKTVIERLNDPLVHLIRNAIDHGIETPEIRKTADKEEMGSIKLSASYSGAEVLIAITDDGAGLDTEKIKDKAVKKGIISPDAELVEKEIFSLLFAPGFSTAEKVTDVSGRGVGMDVVKKSIEALGGTVEVSSTLTQGTTFTLKIPLTLAIIDGLLVEIGEGYYVIPLAVINECIEMNRETVDKAQTVNMMSFRGKPLPYLSLQQLFEEDNRRPEVEKVVVMDILGMRIGMGVDRVAGQIQAVIKSLGVIYRDIEGISGATILGDGTVALIVDPVKIAQVATSLHEHEMELAA